MGTEGKAKKRKGKEEKDDAEVGTSGRLPEHLQKQQDYVVCGADLNYHVRTSLQALCL